MLGAGLVGLAVGPLLALVFDRPLLRGALWGLLAGLAFGLFAALLLAAAP